MVKGSVALFSVVICQYFIKRFVSPYFSMPVSEKFQKWGLIKPKLYEGETYGKPSVTDNIADKFMYYRTYIMSKKPQNKDALAESFKRNENK